MNAPMPPDNQSPLAPDDPRLTAYALGELPAEEVAWVEAELRRDPKLRDVVEQARTLADELAAALTEEPAPRSAPAAATLQLERPRAKVVRFPYLTIGGLAAAGFAVLVALSPDPPSPEPAYEVRRYEIHFGEDAAHDADAALAAVPSREQPFVVAARQPISRVPLAVDDQGYKSLRETLRQGRRPEAPKVRIEDLVNAFPYDYTSVAKNRTAPVAVAVEIAGAPWAPQHRLVRIGLEGRPAADPAASVAADDVRVRVRFNPEQVLSYRLIGYNERGAAAQAGDGPAGEPLPVGATVTAFFEIVPVSAPAEAQPGSGTTSSPTEVGSLPELLTVRLDYRRPEEGGRGRDEYTLSDDGHPFADASPDFRFAAAVAGFGLVLGEAPERGEATLRNVLEWADGARGPDVGGRRAEFVEMVRQAIAVTGS